MQRETVGFGLFSYKNLRASFHVDVLKKSQEHCSSPIFIILIGKREKQMMKKNKDVKLIVFIAL